MTHAPHNANVTLQNAAGRARFVRATSNSRECEAAREYGLLFLRRQDEVIALASVSVGTAARK
jgi:hypothetical protein